MNSRVSSLFSTPIKRARCKIAGPVLFSPEEHSPPGAHGPEISLPRCRHRQAVDEADLPGDGLRLEVIFAVPAERGFGIREGTFWHDLGDDDQAEKIVRLPPADNLPDKRMTPEHRLDLVRVDEFPPALEETIDPAVEPKPTLAIDRDKIGRAKEPLVVDAHEAFVGMEIPEEHRGSGQGEPTGAEWKVDYFRRIDPPAEMWVGPADHSVDDASGIVIVVGDPRAGLGHAVHDPPIGGGKGRGEHGD